jgi:hypothetical protein
VILLLFVSLGSVMASADVGDWLKARSSVEIERLHKKELEMQILYQRCNIELREKWLPKSCFEWLGKADLGKDQKIQIEAFFQQRCKLAAEQRTSLSPSASYFTKMKSGACFEAVRQLYLDWRYRAQQKAELPEISRIVGIGREFELNTGHERKKDPNGRRLSNYR